MPEVPPRLFLPLKCGKFAIPFLSVQAGQTDLEVVPISIASPIPVRFASCSLTGESILVLVVKVFYSYEIKLAGRG